MAGTVWVALVSFAGLNLHGDYPRFDPSLPSHWRKISFFFTFRDDDYECEVTKDLVRIRIDRMVAGNAKVGIRGKEFEMETGEWVEFEI